ncbi:SpvB/TcaC N-terminal domain-containing protein, partial [Leptospira ellisii]|uniref:SpvB/TcaC N-terminal domain-containing protein n=1 Tax=Leptospira ellisii TaxID=2023197 RepID=UPI0024343A27
MENQSSGSSNIAFGKVFFRGLINLHQKKNFKNSTFGIIFSIIVSITTMGFFSLFTSNEESSIPFPIPEISVDSLGKASAGIEIPLPPATAEIKPTISLNYSSGAGNGLVGVGWELGGTETIIRDPAYGVQLNTNDHYLSSNVGSLTTSASNAPYYFSKRESFHRFQPVFDGTCTGGPCGWIEKLPDGITNFYGVADASGDDFNSKIKAEGTNVVKVWALNRVRDRHGNGYDIRYLPSSTTNQYSPIPFQIIYNQGAVVIEFEYENRNDTFSNFAIGGRYRLNTRLSGIQVNFQNSTIDEWDLGYTYSSNHQSQLTTISHTNYEPLNLAYTSGNLSFNTGINHTTKSFLGLDFNAYYKNSDNGACTGAVNTCLGTAFGANPLAALFCAFIIADQSTNCNRGIEKNYTAFVDVTGDERPDFVRLSPAGYQAIDPMLPPTNLFSYALAKIVVNATSISGNSVQVGGGTFESPAFRYTEATKILPGDINGDGKMDFYIVEDYDLNLKLAISNGSGFNLVETNIPTYMPRPDKKRWFYLRPDQKEYQFVSDMNGDGRTDFIQHVGENLVVYFSNGNTLNTSSSNIIPTNSFLYYGQSGQAFIDIDGNGIGDFIRFNNIDNPSTREIIFTLLDENQNKIHQNSRTVQNNGKDGNTFFVDINGDTLVDFVSVTPSGALSVFLFDGKNFATTPYQVGMNGVHPIEDSTQYMSPATANPYLIDAKRDGGPLDKLIETNLQFGAEEITLYLHDNSSQFNESITMVAHLPDNVYQGDAPSVYYDIDKDGQNETLYIHFYYNVFGQQVMALRIHFTSDNSDFEQAIDINALYTASTFSEQPNYPALTNSLYDSWRLSKTFAEMNGDGLADFIWFDGNAIRISYGTQSGDRIIYNSNGDTQITASSFYTATDLNRDGKADLIGIDSAKNEIFSVVNFLSVNSDTAFWLTGIFLFF